jgi:lactate permease
MVMMALVMADAGMMNLIADGLRALVGPAFPLLSPFLGVLGAFMTGSNTNSNVAMGVLQVETAAALGLVPALIAAAQSVGGSIGAGVSPDKAAIGASAAGIQGQEAAIMRRALPYALLATLVVGIEVLALTRLTLFTP